MENNQAQDYVDDLVARRGYVLEYHKVMAAADFPVLKAANQLVEETYLKARKLSAQTKELLAILSLTTLRASKSHIQGHIRLALELGVTSDEILEALEIAIPEAGIVVFQEGLEAWSEVVNAQKIEPMFDPFESKRASLHS